MAIIRASAPLKHQHSGAFRIWGFDGTETRVQSATGNRHRCHSYYFESYSKPTHSTSIRIFTPRIQHGEIDIQLRELFAPRAQPLEDCLLCSNVDHALNRCDQSQISAARPLHINLRSVRRCRAYVLAARNGNRKSESGAYLVGIRRTKRDVEQRGRRRAVVIRLFPLALVQRSASLAFLSACLAPRFRRR